MAELNGNQDPPKTVPIADLMAVKAQLDKFTIDLKAAQDQAGTWQNQHNTVAVEAASLKSQVQEMATAAKALAELKVKSEGDSKTLVGLNKTVLDLKKSIITTRIPNFDATKLEGKSLTELDAIISTIELVVPANSRSQYNGGGGNGSTSALTGRSLIRLGLQDADKVR